MTLDEMRNDYDWPEAFMCAGVDFDAVEEVIASDAGANDEASWVALLRMKNGTFCFLSAWCDYTGWDCQSGGDAWDSETLQRCVLGHMGQDDRKRLGFDDEGNRLEPSGGGR